MSGEERVAVEMLRWIDLPVNLQNVAWCMLCAIALALCIFLLNVFDKPHDGDNHDVY